MFISLRCCQSFRSVVCTRFNCKNDLCLYIKLSSVLGSCSHECPKNIQHECRKLQGAGQFLFGWDVPAHANIPDHHPLKTNSVHPPIIEPETPPQPQLLKDVDQFKFQLCCVLWASCRASGCFLLLRLIIIPNSKKIGPEH